MLRSAEALGVDGVLLSPGCADVYSPKVVRASMGAVFRLPVYEIPTLPGALAKLRAHGMTALAAVPDRDVPDIAAEALSGGIVMCVGNEGAGLTPECIEACGRRVTIRMKGRAESLNAAAAAAILLWEIEKRR